MSTMTEQVSGQLPVKKKKPKITIIDFDYIDKYMSKNTSLYGPKENQFTDPPSNDRIYHLHIIEAFSFEKN